MSATLKKTKEPKIPIYKKYADTNVSNWLDPSVRLTPSMMANPVIDIVASDYPKIKKHNRISDNTHQVHCDVDLDKPLFQSAPKIVVFEDYKPFTIVKQVISFRNMDKVNRAFHILKVQSPFFEISAPMNMNHEPLHQSKIASGMEICYVLTFKPQEVREYAIELECETERELFIVPVRAIGLRPILTIPDEVDFGYCPIKAPAQKKLQVTNNGTSVARFTMKSNSSEFTCPAEDLTIEPGASTAIELYFTPHNTMPVCGEIVIELREGLKYFMTVLGVGQNVEVSLSTSSLTLEPSYISLLSQKTLRIRNLSDAPISYMWKSFANVDEEEAERDRLLSEINRMDEIEQVGLHQRIRNGYYTNRTVSGVVEGNSPFQEGNSTFESYQELGERNDSIPVEARADAACLVRKYRNLRKALEMDNMQFVDDIFEISPVEGQVWAHSEIEITVCCRPDTAAVYNCLAFLDVAGRSDRLPLQLCGQGIGANCALSFEVMNIGDVFINDEQKYEMTIKNKGDIPAQWSFMSPLTRMGNKFQFSPKEGRLLPNQTQKLQIVFESDILGEFAEIFNFSVQGNEDMLQCQIKGNVIGPTFHFDCNTIDFGVVSFDYLHSQPLRLINTSKIPMIFTLEIPQDGTYLKKEFHIEPDRGTIGPKEEIDIMLEFIPATVQTFDYSLAVNVLGVGDAVLSVPITAQCVVSSVSLDSREIDFGNCFIRYPYEQKLNLTNMSGEVRTKFEIMPQPKQTKSVCTYETVPSVNMIEPGGSEDVTIRIVAQKLGPFKVPMIITVAGSLEPPIQAVLSFNTIGPRIIVDSTELRWGNIECLKDSSRTLKISNTGLITASMKIFLKMARSCYRIDVHELVLDAGDSYDLEIIANLDDNVLNKDEIHIVVEDGDNLMVPIMAKGIGTTMYCKSDMSIIDMGVQLTNVHFERQIVLENKGRRPQQLRWFNKTVRDENASRASKAKGKDIVVGSKLPRNLMPVDPQFTVTPEEITLRPRTATTFTFKGFCTVPRDISEIFILESKVGKDRFMKQIIETEVKCSIVNPLLTFSMESVDFVYSWEKGVDIQIQRKELVLTNSSAVTLTFVLKTEVPFNLSTWDMTLQPGQSTEIDVEFDPSYRDDQVSHIVDKLLSINYRGHPQKDTISLRGEVIFPNLKFDMENIHFGCVLNDTLKTVKMKLTNSCKINVNYEWVYLEQVNPKAKSRQSVVSMVNNSVFDILPVRSMLVPGQSEDVEFSMFGVAQNKVHGNVLCVVDGGPEYKFNISGEASTVAYELNRSIIDFGKVVFTDKGDEELIIINPGKVNFNYEIELIGASAAMVLEVIPSNGKVIAGHSSKIIVRVKPGYPCSICEKISIRVAHFDPVTVSCYCTGIFPTAICSLPRYRKLGPFGEADVGDSSVWEAFQSEVFRNIISPDIKMLPPPQELAPSPASASTAIPPVYIPVLPPLPPDFEDVDDKSLAGSSSVGSTKGIPHQTIEMEMQRLVLTHHLNKSVSELMNGPTDKLNTPRTTENGLQLFIAKNIDLKSIVAAHYVCDFGNVVLGQTRKKTFKITNASLVGQLNWVFDKKYFSGSGFSIEPEKVVKLLESGSVDFTVKFFARMQQKIGPKTCILPIENKGSPTINIVFTANTCLPEVELSTYMVDFGKVLVGRSSKMYVRLHNPAPITANWSFKKIKDDNRFTLEPSEGHLKAGKYCIVCVEFMPTDPHRHIAEMSVKIDLNKKTRSLKIVGEGVGTPLKFEPAIVELGPVVPFTEGDDKIVTVFNHSDTALEFFSVDFDHSYKEEEALLSAISEYDIHGVFRTDIRNAGEPLPKSILEAHQRAVSAIADLDQPANDSIKVDGPVVLENAPIRTVPAPRDTNLHQDIIFIGPPICGVSTQAKKLSKKLHLPLKTFDDLIEEVALTNDELGNTARLCLGRMSDDELAPIREKTAELLAVAEQSKADAADAFKKDKKNKGKDVPEEVYLTPEVAAYQTYVDANSASVENLVKIIVFRMQWSDVGYGIVIDNLTSSLVSESVVFKCFQSALPSAVFSLLVINREQEGYESWISSLHFAKIGELDKLQRSIEANKKLLLKNFKPAKGKPVDEMEVILSRGIPECVPSGDESWVNSTTGHVSELESHEFKALEDFEKVLYLQQLLFQQSQEMIGLESIITKILTVWTPAGGLRVDRGDTLDLNDNIASDDRKVDGAEETIPTSQSAAENSKKFKAILYSDYVDRVVSFLSSVPRTVYSPPLSSSNIDEPIASVETESNVNASNSPRIASSIPPGSIPGTAPVTAPGTTVTSPRDNTAEVLSSNTLQPVSSPTDFGVFEILLEGDEGVEDVFASILSLLPPSKVPPIDKNAVPPSSMHQIFKKPLGRPHRRAIKNFEILNLVNENNLSEETSEVVPSAVSNKKGKEEPPAVAASAAEVNVSVLPKTRWIIDPHSSVQFRVKFRAVAEGKFDSSMEFEVVGTHQKFSLSCHGICELPQINSDTRNIFMRRVKSVNPNGSLPQKRFSIGDNYYSFGPLSLFKKPDWKKIIEENSSAEDKDRNSAIESTNMDTIRITNSGKYKCDVDIGLDNFEEDSRDIFAIEPKRIELEEGETKDVRIWALPKEIKEYSNNLIISVVNNPAPLVFNMKCWGVEPTLEIDGPWGEALSKAEAAVAACTDKKLIKDLESKLASLKEALTMDFDRILIKKTDTRSFEIKNTCLMPIAWEIDLDEFKDSPNISISPMSGILPINTTLPIVVSFTSPEPKMLSGKFSFRYSDVEGGLTSVPSRAINKTFRVVAEAYKIQAVSLTAAGQEEGGSEIDFGLVRVGDFAVQTIKMGNRGKYKIGYSFKLTTPTIANLIKIEPMEGVIEAGNALSDIVVTFCSKSAELLMKGNKDIVVQISEPLTGEIVEKFPLFISAQAKYNKYRLQPSKGISFGAVRFDSEAKSKRVELRNEGNFELTYVVLPAIAEHDELDSLDNAAFSCYAYATPAAMRSAELGEEYLKRVSSSDPAAGKGKKDSKPPAKGKGAAVVEAPASNVNPLVQDPDNLALGTLPTDPLVVGAFTVLPRIGIVQPGQSVGIDMKFDPSGCATVKEKMRICLSGVDPKDGLYQAIKTFEVVGESCVPAIVVDDVQSIFEEQEVVNSLADSTGDKSTEGGGKFEKLAVGKVVYAEKEKILAFGPVSCGATVGRGVVERIKISNPTKIDIKVKMKILSPEAAAELAAAGLSAAAAKDAKGKGAKDAKAAPVKGKGAVAAEPEPTIGVFTVQPDKWEIPPHEHRFVNVYFNPIEIKSYRSVFIAEIDDDGVETSAQPKSGSSGKKLQFDIGGTGTLPCIAFDQPTERTADGSLQINFGRILVNRENRKKIIIRNDGVMPSTCLFELVEGDVNDFIFPAKGTSLTILPNAKEEIFVRFSPKSVVGDGSRKSTIKITVLNNPYDIYAIQLSGVAYSCDAIIDTLSRNDSEETESSDTIALTDVVNLPQINLTDMSKSSQIITLKSKSDYPIKFSFSSVESSLSFSPSCGHLAAQGTREITVMFSSSVPIKLDSVAAVCTLNRIDYTGTASGVSEESLWGLWDDSMKSIRPAKPEDLAAISAAETAMSEWLKFSEAEKAKGKKGKPIPPPPEKCMLQLGPMEEDGIQNIYEIVSEPKFNVVSESPAQQLNFSCNGVADFPKYSCVGNGENITFNPTFLFQNTIHKITFTNDCNLSLPITWSFDDIKQRGATARSTLQSRIGTAASHIAPPPKIPCPFFIEPEEASIAPNSTKEFSLRFFPLEVDDFVYVLKGETIAAGDSNANSAMRMILRGTAKRPVCHFDVEETPDYLSRRPANMKNENGLNSPIEVTNIRIVELESVGLRTRNTFRFHITNPTNDNYEFIWESMGDASPYWRCVQSAGMMFAGKRIEIVFEYLPEEVSVAEAFYKFRIPNLGLEQVFLFTGKVSEPKVAFSTSKTDFHSVMLGGEGSTETIYLENKEHLPFNFAFDKYSLLQLEGPSGPVLHISPNNGIVPPHGRVAISLMFKPQEEVVYNYNILCDVKRKPNKLSINIKGEGYAVHPLIQLEQSEAAASAAAGVGSGNAKSSRFLTLRPAPATNYADFGSVQVLDTISKTLSVTNNGKYNFDYAWDIDNISSMLSLSGGKMGGTLLKGEELNYKITFAPQREGNLDGSLMSFTVAGKYVYNIFAKGSGVKPALRFSFMQYDFGPCFITSPGGSTVIEETILRIVNNDPTSNIAIECTFQKTRSMWAECSPTVITPGGMLEVPIRFAPREVKDYAFVIPFVVNGTGKVHVNIMGSGITPRLELVSGSQRRTTFGLVNVGSEASRLVALVNKSKKALPVQLLENGEYGAGSLSDRCVTFSPKSEFVIGPKETMSLQLSFNPNKRVAQFNEDLLVRYAGITRKLLSVSGKAQGTEISLDSDSLPFGVVVLDSQKIKKLVLENTGDMSINFQWNENTFGSHVTILPLSGKLLPGNEVSFDVIFKPKFIDEDIRQDGIELIIPGLDSLKITCTGACVSPPSESVQTLQFNSLARKSDVKSVKIQNPTDKDWYLSPSLQGDDWKIPHEFKVPAKGAADLPVTYFPLTMSSNPATNNSSDAHTGQLFVALPDGSAQLYKLRGVAGPPECAGVVAVETPAKKAATVILKVNNWLSETQKLNVSVEIKEKPTAATFIVAANATEVGPNGTKEFPVRFVSFVEGNSKGIITFTNPVTGEYTFFELNAKTVMPEVLETLYVESPVRQTARYIITIENPLPATANTVTMGSAGKSDWWTCDCKYIKVNELTSLSGNSEGSFEVEYRPLMPTSQPSEHLLTITSKELGTFKYKVVVKATPPLLRQVLRFDVPLGSMQTESFVFHAYNTVKSDYNCSVKKPDFFTVQKTLPVDPVPSGWLGDDIRLNVMFEPTEIGEIRDLLSISSVDGGEYLCELIGNCVAPMPQGPFNLVQGGGSIEIPFRNCFVSTCAWNFSCDSSAFRCTVPSLSVNAKTEGKCTVLFEPKEEHLSAPGGYVTGKLFISCGTKPNLPPWIFYLRGKIDLNAPAVPAAKGKK